MASESHHSILNEHNGIKISEKFLLKLTKDIKNISKEVKNVCKVLHFSFEWSFEGTLAVISKLKPEDYPQLFIFDIYNTNHDEDLAKIQEILIKFGNNRPIILQISSNQDKSEIFLKYETANTFISVSNQPDNLEDKESFEKFLYQFVNNKLDNFEDTVLEMLPKLQHRLIILKFLLILSLSESFYGSMVLEVAKNGSKAELLSALDVPFESNGRILNKDAQKYISEVFEDDDDAENSDSVLLTAVNHKNAEIIDYLITYCSHLIQQLPFHHQVRISTATFETDQLDVLCDLLDIADFPFQKNFKIDSIDHERLSKLIRERIKFKKAISLENYQDITNFTSSHLNLKFVYNTCNNSAMTEAKNQKNFRVFYYLKSLGFQGEDCEQFLMELSEVEKKQALDYRMDKRKEHVSKSLPNVHKSVLKLSLQSYIHNMRISKEQESKLHQNILKWLKDIHQIVPLLLDVAASCNDLKIIFDFESDSVSFICILILNNNLNDNF